MARRKKTEQVVSMDEVREEFAETPVEGEVPAEVQEGAEAEAESQAEGTAPDEVEADAENMEDEAPGEEALDALPFAEGEAYKLIKDTRIVRVALTDAELLEQGRIMIEAMDEATRARAAIKAMQADCKANEERALEKANEAKSLFRSGHEERHVDCHQVHNWTRNMVYTVRLDTGEIIGAREINSWEKQVEIADTAPAEPEQEQTEIDEEGDQPETETEGGDEAQEEADQGDDLDFDGKSETEAEGELVGVGAGEDDTEGEI